MKIEERLNEAMAPYAAERLDASTRGSGFNATWKLQVSGTPIIIKTYASRRGRLKTLLTALEHRLTGRSSYWPQDRQRTERESLEAWHRAGIDVPKLVEHDFSPSPPLPYLCMEYIEGRLLSDILAEDGDLAVKDAVFTRFVKAWGERHALALDKANPGLVQEHATFDHVLVSDTRLTTFDLEVRFVGRHDVEYLVAREICGYLRSLFKRLSDPGIEHFLRLLASAYPYPANLAAVPGQMLANSSPFQRFLHALDLQRSVARGKRMHKFEVARRLAAALGSSEPG